MCSTCSIYCLLDEDFNKENYSLVKDNNLRYLATQHKYKDEVSIQFYEKGYKKDGVLDGKGMRKYLSGKHKGTILEGIFKKGHLISGKITDNMNFIKIGKFNNFKLNGQECTKIFPDGTKHTGNFKNDFLNGTGIAICPRFKTEGIFVNGRLNGKGTKIYDDGRIDKGEFENGNLVKGYRCYPYNIKLHGRFNPEKNIFYEGTKYTLSTVEKGSFENNLLNGYGEIKNLDGNITKGFFENGKLVSCSNKNNYNYLNEHFRKNIYDIKKIHMLAQKLGWCLVSKSNHCKFIKNDKILVLSCTPKKPIFDFFKLRKAEIEFIK